MLNRIPREVLQEIQGRTSLVEVVSQFVTLRRQGRSHVGLCPFHSERSPSFHVDEQKGLYHCFGCKAGGDVFQFLTSLENRPFPEVVRELAEKAGVAIPEPELTPEEQRRTEERENLLRIHEVAAQYFEHSLYGEEGARAVTYLQGRGLPREVAERFRLGFAPPGWTGLADHLSRSAPAREAARAAGLLLEGNNGLYDRFRDRVIFPITGVSGKIIAFGGRILGEGQPKYLNSPESPIFVKGEALYGLTEARKAIGAEDAVLVVEGYFDVLLLHTYGIQNVVATCGTAMTRSHLRSLRRYTRNVVLMFDADAAGQRAAARSLDLFLEEEMWPWYMPLPVGKDPDEAVRAEGAEAFRERLVVAGSLQQRAGAYSYKQWDGETLREQMASRVPLVEHLLSEKCREAVRSAAGMEALLGEVGPILLRLPPTRFTHYVNFLAEHAGIERGVLSEAIERLRRAGGRPAPEPARTSQEARLDLPPEEELLVHWLVQRPQEIAQAATEWEIVDQVTHPGLREVARAALDQYSHQQGVDAGALLRGITDEPLARRLGGLFVKDMDSGAAQGARGMEQLFLKIRQRNLSLQLKSLQEQVARLSRAATDPQELTSLVQQRLILVRENEEIKRRLSGRAA